MTGYEYGNTRLRAMRARLLGPIELETMITAGSLERMLAMLADTSYGPDIEASLVRTRGLRRLDEAVRSNLARTLRQMASFYDEDAHQDVGLLLQRWDLHNLRTLVRLPPALLEPGDVSELLVPAGRLTDAELAELAAQPDIRSRVDLMVAWHIPSVATGPSLARARAQFELDGDAAGLEEALDNAFAEAMEEVLGERRTAAASILRAEFDARNLGSALRRRASRQDEEPGWAESPQQYVGGGSIPVEVWEIVAGTDRAETIADLLIGRRLLSGWSGALREWASHGELTTLTDQLRRATAAAARTRFSSGDPLSLDIPVAYTYTKEAEVRNLRLIGRGIVHGIRAVDIEAGLELAA